MAPRAPLAGLRRILLRLLRRGAPPAISPAQAAVLGATALERALGALGAHHPGRSGFVLLDDGRIAFLLRAALADRAERAIDVQYYAYLADAAGTLLMQRLLAAADRGVRVRLLLDDSALGWRDRALAELDAHPCIDVRLFNPSSARRGLGRLLEFLFNLRRLNRRMHNKMFVVDGTALIVGGRNVSDRYFAGRQRANFRDYDVVAFGPVTAAAAASFEAFWRSPLAVPVPRLAGLAPSPAALAARRTKPAARVARLAPDLAADAAAADAQLRDWLEGAALHWAPGELLSEDPARASGAQGRVIAARLAAVLATAEREVLIESAYFVPGGEGVALFSALRQRGVRVRILTNALAGTDVPAVHAGYAPYRRALLEAGIELHEFRHRPRGRRWLRPRAAAQDETVLHAKVLVVDRRQAWVGSFNVDPRSVALNTEVGVLIESASLAEELATHIEADLGPEHAWQLGLETSGELVWRGRREGRPLAFRRDPEAPWWLRLRVAAYGLVPGLETSL